MELWIARDKDYCLNLYENEPMKKTKEFVNDSKSDYYSISGRLFPEVTWENSPKRVKLEIV